MSPENTLSLDGIRDALEAFEPDYPRLASEWGTAGLPLLRQLLATEDWGVAAKATYLAALIGDVGTVETASKSPNPYVRVAAAGAAPDLGFNDSTEILRRLSNDLDPRVNGVAERIAATNTRLNHLTRRIGNLTSRVRWFGRRRPVFASFVVLVVGISLVIGAYLVFGPSVPREITNSTVIAEPTPDPEPVPEPFPNPFPKPFPKPVPEPTPDKGTGTKDGVPEGPPLPAPPIK